MGKATSLFRPIPRLVRASAAILFGVISLIWIQNRIAKPEMTRFDPVRMGRLEAAMWRSYYEGRWAALAWQGMQVACGEYRFSWWDGARASTYAALAALHFRTNTHDPRCLPKLESYYRIIRQAATREFDIPGAARLELEWWRERRRHVAPPAYAKTIAELTATIYGLDSAVLLSPSEKRARAMAYRDARRKGRITESDWEEIARQLEVAYMEFKVAVSPE